MKQFKKPLIGTMLTWLLLDITFYGTGSFKSEISDRIIVTNLKQKSNQNYLNQNLLSDQKDQEDSRMLQELGQDVKELQNDLDMIKDEVQVDGIQKQSAPIVSKSLFQKATKSNSNSVNSKSAKSILQIDSDLESYSSKLRQNTSDLTKEYEHLHLQQAQHQRQLEIEQQNVRAELQDRSFLALILAIVAIPGYIASILYIEKVGFKRLQLVGFGMMSLCFIVGGGVMVLGKSSSGYAGFNSGDSYSYESTATVVLNQNNKNPDSEQQLNAHNRTSLSTSLLPFLFFSLTFFFSNFGPNTTTFLIPSLAFPTKVRATCHGLSSASGKLGAVIGTVLFSPLLEVYGLGWVLLGCGMVAVLGALITWDFVPGDEEIKRIGEEEENADVGMVMG